jgi:hypothetical protein
MNKFRKAAQANQRERPIETPPMLRGNGFAVSRNLNPNLVGVETLKPLGRENRKHPPAQIRKLQASIEQFGFVLDTSAITVTRCICPFHSRPRTVTALCPAFSGEPEWSSRRVLSLSKSPKRSACSR